MELGIYGGLKGGRAGEIALVFLMQKTKREHFIDRERRR
jgi:hypothetical protein